MLSTLDTIIVVIAAIAMVAVAGYFSKSANDMESFFVANKSLPWSLTVGTLVATWYGGAGTVGTIEWYALSGSSMFLAWSVTAYISRIPLAVWVGPNMQVRTDLTIADVLLKNYGKPAAFIGALLMLVYTCQFGNITSSGFVGNIAWGAPYLVTGVIVIIIVIVIACLAGLMGVAITDFMMFIFLGSAIAITVPITWSQVGGWEGIAAAMESTPEMLDPVGGLTPVEFLKYAIIGLVVYADPAFYQRFSASASPKDGRRALLLCFIIWGVMDMVLMATGFIVDVKYPDLDPGKGYITLVLSTLPVGAKSFFVVAIVGSAISWLDSYLLCGGTIVAHDIIGMFKKNMTGKQELAITRVSIVVLGIIGLLVAFRVTIVQDIFEYTSSVWVAGGVVAVAGALIWKGKKTPAGGLLAMLGGICTYLYLLFIAGVEEPLPYSFAVSLVLFIIGNMIGKPLQQDNVLTVSEEDVVPSANPSELNQPGSGKSTTTAKQKDPMRWPDYALIVGVFVICIFGVVVLAVRSDAFMGYILPAILFIITWTVTISYARQLKNFIKMQKAGLVNMDEVNKE